MGLFLGIWLYCGLIPNSLFLIPDYFLGRLVGTIGIGGHDVPGQRESPGPGPAAKGAVIAASTFSLEGLGVAEPLEQFTILVNIR